MFHEASPNPLEQGNSEAAEASLGLLTVSETAEHLRRSDKTIRRYLRDGRLGYIQDGGGRILIPRDCIERYLQSCYRPAAIHEAIEPDVFEVSSRSRVRFSSPQVRSALAYELENLDLDGERS